MPRPTLSENGLAYPVVNLNGETRKNLINAHMDARRAICDAMATLGETSPNGRDFQTAPSDFYTTARTQYTARFAALDRIANELEEIALAIDAQL